MINVVITEKRQEDLIKKQENHESSLEQEHYIRLVSI